MPVRVTKEKNGRSIIISPDGRFTFDVAREFRAAYRNEPPTVTYIVDLERTEYMDSAALGMLLLLRQHAEEVRERVRLINSKSNIRDLLEIAQFNKYFIID